MGHYAPLRAITGHYSDAARAWWDDRLWGDEIHGTVAGAFQRVAMIAVSSRSTCLSDKVLERYGYHARRYKNARSRFPAIASKPIFLSALVIAWTAG